ncbi:MAG TPA: beta-ketoacyl-[acyl-carrier-protein] synthase family protein [Umezawaea sp.]
MPERRVVVTGFGVISAIGSGREGFLAGLRAGRDGAGPVTAFDTEGFAHGLSCEVPDFADDERSEYGRATRMAAAAAGMAVRDAGLDLERLRGASGVIAIGTTDGDARDLDDLAAVEVAKGLADLDPLLAGRARFSRMPVAVADELGLEDVELITLPDVCAAGTYAIGYGLDAIRSGDADYALCGGADAFCRRTFATFYRMGALSRDVCRPFDVDRTGVVFGEGAAVLVLEPLDTALARGAVIHAEVLDHNLNCDAFHPTRPVGESVAACMSGALVNARVAPGEVDLVFAHGTGTPTNDSMESAALAEVFGSGAVPPVSAIKSMIGHTMGAASAHSCVAALLAMEHGFLPPTANHRTPDPECPVDCVPNAAREGEPRTVLVNALGFGGSNAAVVLRRYRDEVVR